jgi:predicted exporter
LSQQSSRRARRAIMIWLALVVAGLVVIARSHFTADLSAFLPSTPTAQQQLLMDQLRDGIASRMILVGIEGADAASRAAISKKMAQTLRQDAQFLAVNNGEPVTLERDREILFQYRYLLSPGITPQRFTADGLHDALSESVDRLASPAGLLMKELLPRDPTGEMLTLIETMDNGRQPHQVEGVWASRDGKTALLLLQTRAVGSDTDAQQRAMKAVQAAFGTATQGRSDAQLRMTGPGVFSVISRDTIKHQVRTIFIVSSLLIAALLLAVYRSPRMLLLGFLPVTTGIVAGVAAVGLGYGTVHGITLGFGTALIGEAVDYSIYLFLQSRGDEASRVHWVRHVWPTVRLGVLTSVFGFAALLLSGFPGLAQLGLYSIAGLLAAAAMTRFVLPHMLPRDYTLRDVSALGEMTARALQRASAFRVAAIVLLVAAAAMLYQSRDHLWNRELAALSPVPAADLALDTRLRQAMGAPDARYIVVVGGQSEEAALQAAEHAGKALEPLVERGTLAGYESPARYLPSQLTQRARQSALPAPGLLQARVEEAIQDLPLRPGLLTPFLQEVEAARVAVPLDRTALAGTSLALGVDALLLRQHERWNALLPLLAPEGAEIDKLAVEAAVARVPGAVFVDLKTESDRLYSGYQQQAILLSLAGVIAILALLFVTLRNPMRVLRVTFPLVAAVFTVTAGLALCGRPLMILHLIGLLLIVAIGSNYALFFDQAESEHLDPNTMASLLLANFATVLGFGLLAFSTVPILQAMGETVAPGVILALLFSAVFAKRSHA